MKYNFVHAEWLLINPKMVKEASKWVSERHSEDGSSLKWPKGFAAKEAVFLKDQDLTDLEEHLKKAGGADGVEQPVLRLRQAVGELVHIPAGWAHQVDNWVPNLKVAWDVYNPKHLHIYAELQHSIASPVFKAAMSTDYMSVMMLLYEYAARKE